MSISAPFIARPIATWLLAIGILLTGALGYHALPVSALPEVDFPTIQVTTQLPGANPETVETLITASLERQFGQIPGLVTMTSQSSEATSQITLQFDLNRSMDSAAQDVQAAINAAAGTLPANLPYPPVYAKVNPADAPILTLALTSDSMPIDTYLEVFDLREKLVARLAIFEGMRPGEILALRWKSVADEVIRVVERVYKRVFNTPKNGKTREGAMSDGTLELLKEWAGLAQDPSPDGFVFPSEKIVTPVSLDNLWRRHMQPKLVEIGLGWATFQVLRKTNASLSKKAGVDPKVASDQRGHGLGVSMEVYTSSDMEQKRAALKKLEAAVLRKPQPQQPSELAKSA